MFIEKRNRLPACSWPRRPRPKPISRPSRPRCASPASLTDLQDSTSKSQVDTASAGLDSAQSSVSLAQAGLLQTDANLAATDAAQKKLEAAQAQLQQIEVSLDETEIKAPFDGIITAKYIEEGP